MAAPSPTLTALIALLDAEYLKLDASNDPVTASIELSVAGVVKVRLNNTSAATEWNVGNGAVGNFAIWEDATPNAFTIESGAPANAVRIDSSGNVGFGTGTPAAQVDAVQPSASGAIPVLRLEQVDVSEEMIEFDTTIGTGNAIEAVAAKTLTTTHFIKVTLPGGLTRYIPCGTIA